MNSPQSTSMFYSSFQLATFPNLTFFLLSFPDRSRRPLQDGQGRRQQLEEAGEEAAEDGGGGRRRGGRGRGGGGYAAQLA